VRRLLTLSPGTVRLLAGNSVPRTEIPGLIFLAKPLQKCERCPMRSCAASNRQFLSGWFLSSIEAGSEIASGKGEIIFRRFVVH
jgi:hypothetical protein